MFPRRFRARLLRTAVPTLVAVMLASMQSASADPVVNFFKSIGHSISKPGQKPTAKTKPTHEKPGVAKASPSAAAAAAPATSSRAVTSPAPGATATTPSPSASPQNIARASVVSPEAHGSTRDVPYAIPVPNKAGFVTSPYAPNQGLVDVRGFRTGMEVKDPFTGKSFLIP